MPGGAPIASRGRAGQPTGAVLATRGLGGGVGVPTGMTVFNARLGTDHGRVDPSGAAASAGARVLVLGSDLVGRDEVLAVGDRVQAVQTLDVTTDHLLRADLTLRTPDVVPDGAAWEASLLIDGTKVAQMAGRPGQTRSGLDLVANVSKLAGAHVFAVRLELVGT